jgi:hypothetical protein
LVVEEVDIMNRDICTCVVERILDLDLPGGAHAWSPS